MTKKEMYPSSQNIADFHGMTINQIRTLKTGYATKDGERVNQNLSEFLKLKKEFIEHVKKQCAKDKKIPKMKKINKIIRLSDKNT